MTAQAGLGDSDGATKARFLQTKPPSRLRAFVLNLISAKACDYRFGAGRVWNARLRFTAPALFSTRGPLRRTRLRFR